MVGAVAPPRIDLANQELVEAHLHSVWLALLGLKLGRQMVDVLDLEDAAYPLLPEVRAQLELSASRSEDILRALREVVELGGAEIERAGWFSSEWLGQQARSSTAARSTCKACSTRARSGRGSPPSSVTCSSGSRLKASAQTVATFSPPPNVPNHGS